MPRDKTEAHEKIIAAAVGEFMEYGFETARPALQEIDERGCIIQEETNKQHSPRVLFVFIDHEEVVAVVEVVFAGIIIAERSASEVIDGALRNARQFPAGIAHSPTKVNFLHMGKESSV